MSSKKLNILVTGSAGFIGFHLCKILCLNKNNVVTGIDNVNNLLVVKGSIPGKKNSIVYLRDSVKRS